jgi:hypothetical protein
LPVAAVLLMQRPWTRMHQLLQQQLDPPLLM